LSEGKCKEKNLRKRNIATKKKKTKRRNQSQNVYLQVLHLGGTIQFGLPFEIESFPTVELLLPKVHKHQHQKNKTKSPFFLSSSSSKDCKKRKQKKRE
jgi:hypothetical protein